MSGLHRGTATGLTREVAMCDGEVLDLVQLAAEPKGELSRKVVCIANKRISMDRPATGTSTGIGALTTLLQGATKAYTDGTYSVVGHLMGRIKVVAVRKAAAGIVAQYLELRGTTLGSYRSGELGSWFRVDRCGLGGQDAPGSAHKLQITPGH